MTVRAQITVKGEQSGLKQPLSEFTADDIAVTQKADSSEKQTVEIQTSEKERLAEFHETCIEHGLTLTIRRISHEPDQTDERVAATPV